MPKKSPFISSLIITLSAVAAILLKYYFLHQRGYEMDIATFISWSQRISDAGFWSLYSAGYQSGLDYPPLIPYLGHYWLMMDGAMALTSLQLFKLMPTLAEVIFTIIAAIFVYRSKSKYTNILLPLVIIQPALALVTTAWGQVDAILSLFIICGILLIDTSLYLGTIFMFLAFLTKPQAYFGIFIFYLIVLFRKGWKVALRQAVFFAVLLAIAYLIFRHYGSDFLAVYMLSSSRYPYNSMNAFNLWWLLDGSQAIHISDSLGNFVTFKQLGLGLFAAFLVPVIWYLYKKAKTIPEYFLAASYIYLIFFVFPTQIHERYLFPAIALAPFAAVKDKKIFWIYILLTITLFLNNYSVLNSAFPQFEALAKLNTYLDLGGSWTKAVALVNLLIAIYLALYFIYESFKKSKQ